MESFMKYLSLVYGEEKTLDAMPERDMQTLIDNSLAYDDALRESGHFVAAEALQSVKQGRTLRKRGGKLTVTDGPFAETKEQLLGFLLIEAKDMTEAIALASKVPLLEQGGTIEVRAIMELKASDSNLSSRR
jgi:hypothetical protein